MIRVTTDTLTIETRTLRARMQRGVLTSLRSIAGGPELLAPAARLAPPLELVYAASESVPLGSSPGDTVSARLLGDRCAEIRVESWNGDGVIVVREDPETGDLIVEPSGYSSRPGLRAVRWTLEGIAPGLDLVAPFFQGIRMPLEDSHIRDTHWVWPHSWEAGMFILQAAGHGAWVHCRDRGHRYKALRVGSPDDARRVGLETEAYGPLERSLAAGGLEWRVNVHTGDWREPAGRYRDWFSERLRTAREWATGVDR